jgi:hypothetical protein
MLIALKRIVATAAAVTLSAAPVRAQAVPHFRDVVAVHQGVNTLFAFRGLGTGGFETGFDESPLSMGPIHLIVGDLSGDGQDDLVLTSQGGFSVVLRREDGSLEESHVYQDDARGEVIADFNGDGIQDVVAVASSAVRLFLGEGDGTGALHPPITVPVPTSYGDVASGDFDGDGDVDLAIINTNFTSIHSVSILLNEGTGAGSFEEPLEFSVPAIPQDLTAGDFNGDAFADLAVVGGVWGNHDVYVLLGGGDGTFAQSKIFESGFFGGSGIEARGDLDANGLDDLVLTTSAGIDGDPRIVVLTNTGAGAFTNSQQWTTDWGPAHLGDLNGDGRLDLVRPSTQSSHTLETRLGIGDGTFALGVDHNLGLSDVTRLAMISRNPVSTLVELASSEGVLHETVATATSQALGLVVDGDLSGAADITMLSITSLETGPFDGKGFFGGEADIALDGASYSVTMSGLAYEDPSDGTVVLRGTVHGDLAATFEGLLSESSPGSGIHDLLHGAWRISRLGTSTTSAMVTLEGFVTPLGTVAIPDTRLALTWSQFGGSVSHGDYSGTTIELILTRFDIADAGHPQSGEGFSIASYFSPLGSGLAWGHNVSSDPNRVDVSALVEGPLFGLGAALIHTDEQPPEMFLTVGRTDLGWPPMADLRVKTWGPENVSPGQTVNVTIEYSNVGVTEAEDVVIIQTAPNVGEVISTSAGGIYRSDRHEWYWPIGPVAVGESGYVSLTIRYPWGLPQGLTDPMLTLAATTSPELDGFLHPEILQPDALAYLLHEPVSVVVSEELDASEVATLLAISDVSDVVEHGVQLGLDASEIGIRMVTDDGGEVTRLLMHDAAGGTLAFVSFANETALLEQYTETAVSLSTSSGGITYDVETDIIDAWGDWGEPEATFPGVCFQNCLFTKMPKLLLKHLFKFVKLVLSTANCVQCGASKFEDVIKCGKCVAALKKLPFVSDGLTILNCWKECAEDPGKYDCRVGSTIKKCGSGGFWGLLGLESSNTYDCIEPGVWSFSGSEPCFQGQCVFFPGAMETCIVCQGGECRCVPCDQLTEPEVTTAHDPNAKYGPHGNVEAGETLSYAVEYENEGQGIAFGVYITDTLSEWLDAETLSIGPLLDVVTGKVIAEPGTFEPTTRTITWFVGEVPSGSGGISEYTIAVLEEAPPGTEITNFATVYFPSVPEETRTNSVVSTVAPEDTEDVVLLVLGDRVRGTLAPEEVHALEFEAVAGSRIALTCRRKGKGEFQPAFRLWDPDGIELVAIEETQVNEKLARIPKSQRTLAATGLYRLEISETSGSGGDYLFSTAARHPKAFSVTQPVAIGDPEAPVEPIAISVIAGSAGTKIVARSVKPKGDYATVGGQSANLRPALRVQDAEGHAVLMKRVSMNKPGTRLTVKGLHFPKGGTYSLVLEGGDETVGFATVKGRLKMPRGKSTLTLPLPSQ